MDCVDLTPIVDATAPTYAVTEDDIAQHLCLSMAVTGNHDKTGEMVTHGTNLKVRASLLHHRQGVLSIFDECFDSDYCLDDQLIIYIE